MSRVNTYRDLCTFHKLRKIASSSMLSSREPLIAALKARCCLTNWIDPSILFLQISCRSLVRAELTEIGPKSPGHWSAAFLLTKILLDMRR